MLNNSIDSNKDFLRFVGGDRGVLELSFSVLFRVGSPRAELFLKLFKFYF